ncbi:uncharacterized protein ALTATR162_LOCUS5616 [Alternaria atra]|uniref:Uncharacterized protein n=1 Tax=Alternaria atra TaxID=119953 RepID=A0A8J2I336_9PLEO|nr:uncharacterized protein ALTATR162_LOCUS5616 [Alternaria atra]CAG5159510.1 unnamed protein product [Alternaria atra]
MRAFLLAYLAVLGLVVCEVPLHSSSEFLLNTSSLAVEDSGGIVKRAPVAPADDFLWQTCGCRGQKLQLMDTLDPVNAARFGTPLNSPWVGTLENELTTWGYKDNSANDDIQDLCDFTMKPMFEAVLRTLGIGAGSAQYGGPNKCFSYVHREGPAVQLQPNGQMPPRNQQRYTVDGVSYRVTNAYYTIGINAQAGVIHLLNRKSPESAAKTLWGVESAPRNELPALKSSSDIAWGMWERMSPGNLGNINYIFSHSIVNKETQAIILRALDGQPLAPWPGTEFVAGEASEYWALLGSPNGVAVGYILGQHKPQFGHNRYVSSIHIFQGSPANPVWLIGILPWLCFVVKPAPYPAPQPPDEVMGETNAFVPGKSDLVDEDRVVDRSEDGKNIVRSHKIWAKM